MQNIIIIDQFVKTSKMFRVVPKTDIMNNSMDYTFEQGQEYLTFGVRMKNDSDVHEEIFIFNTYDYSYMLLKKEYAKTYFNYLVDKPISRDLELKIISRLENKIKIKIKELPYEY